MVSLPETTGPRSPTRGATPSTKDLVILTTGKLLCDTIASRVAEAREGSTSWEDVPTLVENDLLHRDETDPAELVSEAEDRLHDAVHLLRRANKPVEPDGVSVADALDHAVAAVISLGGITDEAVPDCERASSKPRKALLTTIHIVVPFDDEAPNAHADACHYLTELLTVGEEGCGHIIDWGYANPYPNTPWREVELPPDYEEGDFYHTLLKNEGERGPEEPGTHTPTHRK